MGIYWSHPPRSEEYRKKLSNSLKGRKVWNKGKKGLQVAWNKIRLPENEILGLYTNTNMSSKRIADIYSVSRSVIIRILHENNIPMKSAKEMFSGKTIEEIYGQEKAQKIREKISSSLKGKNYLWQDKIKVGLAKYYQNPRIITFEERKKRSLISKNMWANKDYREKLVAIHKERLKNNPKELERLKSMQLNKVSKIEVKMLNFLRENFIEDIDFYFDKQDITNKTLYRPDFQFPKQKIIIELYGYYKHFTNEGKQKDKVREYYLKKAGWKVYKFNFLEIARDFRFEKTKEKVLKIINNG